MSDLHLDEEFELPKSEDIDELAAGLDTDAGTLKAIKTNIQLEYQLKLEKLKMKILQE